jgi:S1-C subfamily serine protease
MNLADLVIILLLVTAVFRGTEAGLLRILLSSAGFISGLLLGSWIARQIATHYSSPLTKLMIIILVEFGLAVLLAAAGELLAIKLGRYTERWRLAKANRVLGAGLEVVLTLLIIWLLASALQNIHSEQIGRDIRRSQIIRWLDAALPSPPDVLAQLEKIIDPNGFPNVFLGPEPRHATVSPTNKVSSKAVLAAEKSVVQIEGNGCGGQVYGSGFVVGSGLVVTNAHVVAGIPHPIVLDQTGHFSATAIWFDPNMDIAILRVANLNDPPLQLNSQILPDSDAVASLGYPHGGSLVVENGVILDHITAAGRNIYNRGIVVRSIYEVQTDVQPGDSGGPLLAPDGTVAGVIFARSLSQDSVGYALLISEVKPIIQKAKQQNTLVDTGACAQD